MKLWDEKDKRLSIVPRWAIVHTIQKQSVAEHCFRVARLVEKIMTRFQYHRDQINEAMRYALHHDDDEHVTGDVPSIAKKYLDTDAIGRDFPVDAPIFADARHIVKVADKVEAIIFLRTEKALGNNTVDKVLDHVQKSLAKYCGDNDLIPMLVFLKVQLDRLDVTTDTLER